MPVLAEAIPWQLLLSLKAVWFLGHIVRGSELADEEHGYSCPVLRGHGPCGLGIPVSSLPLSWVNSVSIFLYSDSCCTLAYASYISRNLSIDSDPSNVSRCSRGSSASLPSARWRSDGAQL